MPFLRRTFLQSTGAGLSSAIAGLAGSAFLCQERSRSQSSIVGLPATGGVLRKIDMHNHVLDPFIARMEVGNASRPWSRLPIFSELKSSAVHSLSPAESMADIDQVRSANDAVLAAMKRYPDLIQGFCFAQPVKGCWRIDEIQRCLDAGMIGVKLYNQVQVLNPMFIPLPKNALKLAFLLLGHSAHLTDAKTIAMQPKTSDSLDFCQLSVDTPELLLILGHVNGGGDWMRAIKGLLDCPMFIVDTSGSVLEKRYDRAMSSRQLAIVASFLRRTKPWKEGVGKILSARLEHRTARSHLFGQCLQDFGATPKIDHRFQCLSRALCFSTYD